MKIKFLFFLFIATLVIGVGHEALAQFEYQPFEKIPGSPATGDFPAYVSNIYKFGLWAVGIAALLMLTIGGFMYMTSAGNVATLGRAKGIIWDALLGVILALVAWLILYVINPDLVKVNITIFSQVGGTVIAPKTETTPVVYSPPSAPITANETLPKATSIDNDSYPDTWFPDEDQSNMIKELKPYGIKVKNSANKEGEEALCKKEKQAEACTSLYKFPSDAKNILKNMGAQCMEFNKGTPCDIAITGGTEYWKHSKTTHHMPGNPVIDIGKNSSGGVGGAFFKYLQDKIKSPSCQRGGRNVYTLPINTGFGIKYIYLWDEDSIHWHVNVNVDMCH